MIFMISLVKIMILTMKENHDFSYESHDFHKQHLDFHSKFEAKPAPTWNEHTQFQLKFN